jgi:kinesin family member 6/9
MATMGKLNLVDLAGSERMFKTDTATLLKTRIEGRYINLSLHYLEQVIVALQEKARYDRWVCWLSLRTVVGF